MYIKNCCMHLKTILTHKKYVFLLCLKAGIPWQGIVHDLSKFTPIEFFESVKYYTGTRSPIMACKEDIGYSMAWQHHKGINKHHAEWWVDKLYQGGVPIQIPYKYVVEMVCDIIGASKAYNGDNYTSNMPYDYWINKLKDTTLMHKKSQMFVRTILKDYLIYGDAALNKRHTKYIYEKINEMIL